MTGPSRVFLLSPARADGLRGQRLLDPESSLEIAVTLRGSGVAVGDVFQFISGLYFRGKLAYARRFVDRGLAEPGVLVIAPGFGLVDPDWRITDRELRQMTATGVSESEPRFREPLARDAVALAARLGADATVVLLGSIATGKYVGPLAEALGDRLRFPIDFVGRGDMSRGGLMLRCVDEGRELEYAPVIGTERRGARPPRLPRLPRRTP